jgi:hypothetical protein
MYCAQCGAQGTADDTFCAECGEPMAQPPHNQAGVTDHTPVSNVAAAGPTSTNGVAIAALVCGILGILGGLPAVLAIIFGYVGRRQIDESRGLVGGRGFATAGIVLGWIGVAILIFWIVIIVVLNHAVSNGAGG